MIIFFIPQTFHLLTSVIILAVRWIMNLEIRGKNYPKKVLIHSMSTWRFFWILFMWIFNSRNLDLNQVNLTNKLKRDERPRQSLLKLNLLNTYQRHFWTVLEYLVQGISQSPPHPYPQILSFAWHNNCTFYSFRLSVHNVELICFYYKHVVYYWLNSLKIDCL